MQDVSAWDDAKDVLYTSGVECQVSGDWQWFVAGPFRNTSKAKIFASRCEQMGYVTDSGGSNKLYIKFV